MLSHRRSFATASRHGPSLALSRHGSYEDNFAVILSSRPVGPAGRRPGSCACTDHPLPPAAGQNDPLEHSAPLKLRGEGELHEDSPEDAPQNEAPPVQTVRPAVASVTALLTLSAIVLVGATLTLNPEYHKNADQAAEVLGTVNALVKELWVAPLTIPWVDDSLRSRDMTPPPPPPAPECINATEELRALDAFDRFAKDQVAEGAAVVSARNLHWSYAGSLFFMFTLQTTIVGAARSEPATVGLLAIC